MSLSTSYQRLKKIGFIPTTVLDVGAYHGDWTRFTQSIFPSAASQGALGIEMRGDRNDGGKLYNILAQLSHSKTVEEVVRERKTFKKLR